MTKWLRVTVTLASVVLAASCSSGGGFVAGGAFAHSRVPTSWLAHDDTSVEFLQWNMTGTSSDGTDISGTLKGFDASEQGPSPAVETMTFTGHINKDDVTLSLEGSTITGTVDGDTLTLDSTDDTDGSNAITFTAATEKQYEAAADELRAKAPELSLRSQMNSDAGTVAMDLLTVAVDDIPFSLRDNGDGVVELGEGMKEILSPGDRAVLKVTPDGSDFCLLITNPDSPQGVMYLSDPNVEQRILTGNQCPAKYSETAPEP